MGIQSYINSEQFVLDFMPIKIGEDTIEWSQIRGRTVKKIMWMNGHLMNVSSAKRVRGTIDDFSTYVYKGLHSIFKNDPEVKFCQDMVRSFVSDLHFTKVYKG